MSSQDLFEDLCKFYEFVLGPLPRRDEFKRTLQDTVTADELRVFWPPKVIVVDEVIADPSGVLPIDVVSEMIRRDARLIGVAECYCRKTKRIVGQGCEHPLEACFVFNELAQTLIHNGLARQVEYDETMRIIWECEERGLVHNVDNCREEIRSLRR